MWKKLCSFLCVVLDLPASLSVMWIFLISLFSATHYDNYAEDGRVLLIDNICYY
jgi:hypothetical protein